MRVIGKTGFSMLWGLAVSTICVLAITTLAESTKDTSFKTALTPKITSEIVLDLNFKKNLNNKKFQVALVQLRQNINLSTSNLLETTKD